MTTIQTMVALVSDQRMQNLLPLYQSGMTPQKLILVVSALQAEPNPAYLRIARHLKEAIEADSSFALPLQVEIATKSVPPFEVTVAQAVLETILTRYDPNTTMLNLTGGTKPMSIAAYAAAQNQGVAALYVDSAGKQFFSLPTTGASRAIRFNLHPISIKTALQAHGWHIDEKKTKAQQPTAQEIAFVRALRGRFAGIKRAIPKLSYRLRRATFPVRLPIQAFVLLDKWLADALQQSNLFQQINGEFIIHQKGWNFLKKGKWLEIYTYVALLDSGRFDDVLANVYVAGAENELDTICIKDGKLILVECKAGIGLAKQRQSGDHMAILNKIEVLREQLGGLFAQTFVVSPLEQRKIAPAFSSRAERLRVNVIASGKLGQIDHYITQALYPCLLLTFLTPLLQPKATKFNKLLGKLLPPPTITPVTLIMGDPFQNRLLLVSMASL